MKIQVAIPIQFLTEIEVNDDLLTKDDIEYLKNDIWENMDRTYEEVEHKLMEKCKIFNDFMNNTKFNIQEDDSRDVVYWIQ